MRILMCFMILSTVSIGQETVELYTEQVGSSIYIYANSDEVIPTTADLRLDLTGMKSDLPGNSGLVIIPPNAKKFVVAEAKASVKRGKIGFSMKSATYPGDLTTKPDRSHVYNLPFKKEGKYKVFQGYDGRFSHQGENALDFGLDIGEEVYAARAGVVYEVVERHTKGCERSSCMEYSNLIKIYHDDGTTAEYVHLKYEGGVVEVGDRVEASQLIGYSGNTGWTSGPHLHFMVFHVTHEGKRKSIKTKFKTKEGAVYLKESEFYQW